MGNSRCEFWSHCSITHILKKNEDDEYNKIAKTLTGLTKKEYCYSNIRSLMGCARYRLARMIGIENVPIGLTPYDHDFVDNVEKAQKYSKNMLN